MNYKVAKFYRNNLNEVLHTTLNPYEPGVVRIHLVPAKYNFFKIRPSLAILNGQDILPVNLSWTILLANFIKEVNKFEGNEVTADDLKIIVENTVAEMKKIYKREKREIFVDDLKRIIAAFIDIAEGREPKEEIGQLSIGEYAPNMIAPHRMDLMVSSMTKEGNWNCNQKCLHCYAAGQSRQ